MNWIAGGGTGEQRKHSYICKTLSLLIFIKKIREDKLVDLRVCKYGHFYDGDRYNICPHCNTFVNNRNTANYSHNNTSMRKVCANCKQTYNDGDRYCRFCGAPMGTPDFIEEDFATIYGPPPIRRKHRCTRCGYKYETNQMIDRGKYCPICGHRTLCKEE